MRCVALVDANNFYASCETLFEPGLRGRPLVVLSNNDGCIVSRSAEAKQLGVPMGAPIHLWQRFCAQRGVILRSSNYALYGDLSQRMVTLLQGFSPEVEVYSIDESFVDLSGEPNATATGRRIRDTLARQLRLTVGVGVAPSKTLAKFANHLAKRQACWGGVFNTADHEPTLLEALMSASPVDEVWGVGRRLADRLAADGLHTVLDLRRADPARIRRAYGVILERTVRELNGLSCLSIEQVEPPRRQILSSRSFGRLVHDLPSLQAALTRHACRAAEKLRRQQGRARLVGVMIRTNPFRDVPDRRTAWIGLDHHSADSVLLTRAALAGLTQLFVPGKAYHKAGVILADIQPDGALQSDLFAPGDDPRQLRLMQALDAVNRRLGRDTLCLASERQGQGWQMRMARRSPRYTTRPEEFPVVHART